MNKEVLVTGGRPTGKMHLGHYIGAFKNFIEIQQCYNSFFILSDIHMLTTAARKKSIEAIWENAVDMVIDVISMGVDPRSTTFYLQSNIPEMPYYYTLIQNFISIEKIYSMPSLINTINEMKENSALPSISLGLLAYPVMEAADVMLLEADVVPVGKDNIDHIEIAKIIVDAINKESNFVLKSPQWLSTEANNILGIDGKKKMSKSLGNCIFVSDSIDEVSLKINQMPWEPVCTRENVIIKYIKIFAPESLVLEDDAQMVQRGELYCKSFLLSIFESLLTKMQSRSKYYKENRDEVEQLIINGTEQVRSIAIESLQKLKRGLGYNPQHCT